MHNDGTGPRYDRPRRPRPVTRDEVRRPEPTEPTEFERYQALLADGIPDADARTAIWPDNALVYGTDENGNSVLLPVGDDGLTIVPEGFAEGDLYPPAEQTEDDQNADGDDTTEDDETETPAADAEEHAEGADTTEVAPTATETENGAETPAEPVTETEEPVTAPDEGYEPADHNRNEVQKYLSENPDQAEYVLARERTGKARVSLIGA